MTQFKGMSEMRRSWQSEPLDLQSRLCGQIDKLRAEIERLKAEDDISDGLLADAKAKIEQLRAEVAWLTKELSKYPDAGRRALGQKDKDERRSIRSGDG